MLRALTYSFSCFFGIAASVAPVGAVTMDLNTTADLEYIASDTNSYIVKLDTRISAQPDTFNTNWAVQDCNNVNNISCQIGTSSTNRTLSDIGFDTDGFFRLGFDAQEVGGDTSITLFGAKLEIGGTTVWELNPGQDYTVGVDVPPISDADATPNQVIQLVADTFGNDIDLILKLPVDLLLVMVPDAIGSALVELTWLQSDYSNGNDEWTLSTSSAPGVSFLGPNEVLISAVPVPVPASALLLASGLGLAGFLRRRRTAAPQS